MVLSGAVKNGTGIPANTNNRESDIVSPALYVLGLVVAFVLGFLLRDLLRHFLAPTVSTGQLTGRDFLKTLAMLIDHLVDNQIVNWPTRGSAAWNEVPEDLRGVCSSADAMQHVLSKDGEIVIRFCPRHGHNGTVRVIAVAQEEGEVRVLIRPDEYVRDFDRRR
jgi:hypothetical protein